MPPQMAQDIADVVARLGIVGVHRQRLLVTGQRIVIAPQPPQGEAPAFQRRRIEGPPRQGALQMRQRLGGTVQLQKHIAAMQLCLGDIRIDLQRREQFLQRLFMTPLLGQE